MTNSQLPITNYSSPRYSIIPRVLCFVTWMDEVLLLKGAPDKKLWAGKYNGLGGHVERGESGHAAAQREILEESGLADIYHRDDGGEYHIPHKRPRRSVVVLPSNAALAPHTPPAGGNLGPIPPRRA